MRRRLPQEAWQVGRHNKAYQGRATAQKRRPRHQDFRAHGLGTREVGRVAWQDIEG